MNGRTITVREWFRLARREAWETPKRWPAIDIYFHDALGYVGPLTPRTTIYSVIEIQQLIETGAPVHPFDRMRLRPSETILA